MNTWNEMSDQPAVSTFVIRPMVSNPLNSSSSFRVSLQHEFDPNLFTREPPTRFETDNEFLKIHSESTTQSDMSNLMAHLWEQSVSQYECYRLPIRAIYTLLSRYEVSDPQLQDLEKALAELADAPVEAQEEGFPIPSDLALGHAGRLIRELHRVFPRRYFIYPTPDAEVAVDAPGSTGSSVLILCDSDGGALCLVNMKGKHRRARYETADQLPDGFVFEALTELKKPDTLACD